jgi:hypothetical protein
MTQATEDEDDDEDEMDKTWRNHAWQVIFRER